TIRSPRRSRSASRSGRSNASGAGASGAAGRSALALLGAPFGPAAGIVLVGQAREDAPVVALQPGDLLGEERAFGRRSFAGMGGQRPPVPPVVLRSAPS